MMTWDEVRDMLTAEVNIERARRLLDELELDREKPVGALSTGNLQKLAVILAVAIGLFTAYINTKLLRYLKRTSVSRRLPDSRIAGNAATVVVPISDDSRGKISVDINGQRLYLIATPFTSGRGDTYAIGDTVVIVEVDRGSALVTAMDDLD